MNLSQPKISTDAWVNATWEEYLSAISTLCNSEGTDDPQYAKAKSYYYDHQMRIEMVPLGHDHAADNTIASIAVTLFCSLKGIPAKGLINCSYRKPRINEAQPDLSYYLRENANVIPWGTTIIDLEEFPPPDLVIEIANSSLPDDQGAKRLMYEDLGVKEYWIFDVKNVQVLGFAIENQGSYRLTESKVLPGLTIALLQEALQRSRQTNQSEVVGWLMQEFQRS